MAIGEILLSFMTKKLIKLNISLIYVLDIMIYLKTEELKPGATNVQREPGFAEISFMIHTIIIIILFYHRISDRIVQTRTMIL